MSTETLAKRGRIWFDAAVGVAPRVETGLASLLVADRILAGERVRLLAIVPDPNNRFPRAWHGARRAGRRRGGSSSRR